VTSDNVIITSRVTVYYLGILYQEEVAYCYQLINVINLGLAQIDHIKRLPLYLKFTKNISAEIITRQLDNLLVNN
jgi:hypothetical protein